MPAATTLDRRERFIALAAVASVQAVIALGLLIGLRIGDIGKHEVISRLIDVTLTPPPPPPPPLPSKPRTAAAPRAEPKPIGGSPGPAPHHATIAPTPMVAIRPTAAAGGGGTGAGPAAGAGMGGGTGGDGDGADEGGTDLEQIAGAITPRDYPRDLRERGLGGRVGMVFTVGPSGRVTSCRITRSSGIAELDSLTCRLIQQRFVYRPSTDRYGRPIADEVEGEHDWVPGGR